MAALHVSTIHELRKVSVDKLVDYTTSGSRGVDDGYFFQNGSSTERLPTNETTQVPEKLSAKCVIGQYVTDTHGTHTLRVSYLHHNILAVVPCPTAHTANKQLV